MKMMKQLSALFLTLVLCFGLMTGCAKESNESLQSSTENPSSYKIAVAIPRLSNPFNGRAVDILQAYAKELGNVELVVMDAEDDSATQIQQIEDAITMQVDGVIIAPVTSDALVPAAGALEEAGIPLVTVDRKVDSDNILGHVGGNNVLGGQLAGEYVAEKLTGEICKVAMLLGPLGAVPTSERQDGFKEAIEQNPSIMLIEETANNTRSEAMTVTENILQAHPDLQAIFAQNDEMGLGAVEALQAMGYSKGDVLVIGFDTSVETLQAVSSGWEQANIEQFPDKQFRTGLDILLSYLENGTTPEQTYQYISPAVIEQDNLSDSEKYEDFQNAG